MPRWLTRLMASLDRLELIVAELCLAGMVSAVALQVFCRYVLNHPLLWPEELATLLLVYLTFIGASVALRRRRHIAIDYFSKLWGQRVQRHLDVLIDVLAIIFLSVVLVEALKLLPAESSYTVATLRIPRSVYTAPLAMAAASSILTVAFELVSKVDHLLPSRR